MPLTRRELLGRSAVLAAGAGLATALPATAAKKPAAQWATGPLADVYGQLGAPRGRVLAYGPDDASRWVTWLTTGDDPVGTIVEYGVLPPSTPPGKRAKHLNRVTHGTSELAPRGRFDEGAGTTTPIEGDYAVRVHRALLPALPAGAEVAYRVGDGAWWSDVRTLRTPASAERFRLAHFGDHGNRGASRRMVETLRQRRPDAVLLAGDISYANGYQPAWDVWARQSEPLLSEVPLLPAPGNHEAKDFYGATYRARFAHPQRGRNWYAVDLGRVHLFSGTAGCFLTENDPQTARDLVADELVGLENDLAVAAARRAAGEIDFLVVAQHFPLYTNHETRGPFSPELVVAQEHILQRYQVDLVVVGHDHMYQRSHPMAYGNALPGGAAGYVQVIAGAGGQGLYEFLDPASPDWGEWCAAWSRQFSFVEYDVAPGRITATAWGWGDEGDNPDAVDPMRAPQVIDRFTVERRVALSVPAPRPVEAILANVPEAHGVVVRNLAEDCTRH